MDPETARQLLREMFDQTASRYVERIDPAFKPLADSLVALAAPAPGERVLDLGTGTGLAAIAAAPQAGCVVALDYSGRLLVQARAKLQAPALRKVTLVQGDMHALGFAAGTFDVVVGAFSFNSTDPARVFPEVLRVLRPGGRLVMQEWGATDEPSEIVREAIADYAVDDPPAPLAALREALSTPDTWDDLEGVDDLAHALASAGFQAITVREEKGSVTFEGVDAFLDYKLAWASRHEEIKAMPADLRDLFFGELHEQLRPFCREDDRLVWEPELIQVRAFKPT